MAAWWNSKNVCTPTASSVTLIAQELNLQLLSLLFLGLLFLNYRLSCGKARDWHSER
jgi:hypothetical protein